MRALFRSPLALAVLALGLAATMTQASPIKDDEEVIFFRTGTAVAADAEHWALPVRAWVFEREENSWMRKILLKALAKALGLPPDSPDRELFQQRAALFLADSESRKDVVVKIGSQTFELPRTPSNGVTAAILKASPQGAAPTDPRFLRYRAELREGDERRFEGQILLAPPAGTVVVSDIDDTVKVTQVKDRKEMLRNTFLRPFRAVPGMAERYAGWAAEGAVFHFVSSSPIQLYPHLASFLDDSGFPVGGVHLRTFFGKDARDAASEDLLADSEDHKKNTIRTLMALHPDRDFVLVGDSGEHDPEIYGALARENPERVQKIMIRKAPGGDETDERYAAAFEGLPAGSWEVFDAPAP